MSACSFSPPKLSRCFCRDPHIPNLLAFPLHSLNLPKFPPYQDARVIAQDKASCMPAFLLVQDLVSNPTSEGVTVIDATSAPGNKTSYVALALSAHLPAQSAVLAFERDSNRFVTLQKMMRRAGCDSKQNASGLIYVVTRDLCDVILV